MLPLCEGEIGAEKLYPNDMAVSSECKTASSFSKNATRGQELRRLQGIPLGLVQVISVSRDMGVE